tara:strand:+ start:721 stop:924 length:204 start_codon:yes stop_codon:yes gene_type:complete
MKSSDVECNKTYWSKRFKEQCVCTGIARYFIRLEFPDSKKNGWYHCQEVENLPKSVENIIDISHLIR